MDDLEDFVMRRLPTADRPLLGLTVLVVEDSRYACEAIRLMCIRSGARIRRADSLRSAAKHLKVYRPAIVIIDLGLPDGSGTDLIRELAACSPRVGVIIGVSGDDGARELALEAGADGFLTKPIGALAEFQECILEHMPREAAPRGIRKVPDDVLVPDTIALKDDIAHVVDILEHRSDRQTFDYVSQFLSGVAKSSGDDGLFGAVQNLLPPGKNDLPSAAAVAEISSLLKDRLAQAKIV